MRVTRMFTRFQFARKPSTRLSSKGWKLAVVGVCALGAQSLSEPVAAAEPSIWGVPKIEAPIWPVAYDKLEFDQKVLLEPEMWSGVRVHSVIQMANNDSFTQGSATAKYGPPDPNGNSLNLNVSVGHQTAQHDVNIQGDHVGALFGKYCCSQLPMFNNLSSETTLQYNQHFSAVENKLSYQSKDRLSELCGYMSGLAQAVGFSFTKALSHTATSIVGIRAIHISGHETLLHGIYRNMDARTGSVWIIQAGTTEGGVVSAGFSQPLAQNQYLATQIKYSLMAHQSLVQLGWRLGIDGLNLMNLLDTTGRLQSSVRYGMGSVDLQACTDLRTNGEISFGIGLVSTWKRNE